MSFRDTEITLMGWWPQERPWSQTTWAKPPAQPALSVRFGQGTVSFSIKLGITELACRLGKINWATGNMWRAHCTSLWRKTKKPWGQMGWWAPISKESNVKCQSNVPGHLTLSSLVWLKTFLIICVQQFTMRKSTNFSWQCSLIQFLLNQKTTPASSH